MTDKELLTRLRELAVIDEDAGDSDREYGVSAATRQDLPCVRHMVRMGVERSAAGSN